MQRMFSKVLTTQKQHEEKIQEITLKQVFQLTEKKETPANMIYSTKSSLASLQLYFKLGPLNYACQLQDINDYANVSFVELCQFSQTQGSMAVAILTKFLEILDRVDNPDTRTKLLKSLLGSDAIDGLVNVTNLHFIQVILANTMMIKHLGLPEKKYIMLHPCMLDEIDFKEAIELSERKSEYHKKPHSEGYYNSDKKDELYKYASSLSSKFYLSKQEKRTLLQKKALEMKGYYPIPEIKPWPGQDKFIQLMNFFEKSSSSTDHEKPDEIFSTDMLAIHGMQLATTGVMTQHYLPMPGDKTSWFDKSSAMYKGRFFLTLSEFKQPPEQEDGMDLFMRGTLKTAGLSDAVYLKNFKRMNQSRKADKTQLSWDRYFLLYVNHYDVIPSENFLVTLQKIVMLYQKPCRDEWDMALSGLKYKQRIDNTLRVVGRFSKDVANLVIEYTNEEESKKPKM